ncbi:hypothetical protein [Thermoanaerobacter mathranii]|uniref:hypothetical protein n=1 Tax=Thermoanaerobacter mathranii TaxID=583357 RepID=UPI003D6A2BF5
MSRTVSDESFEFFNKSAYSWLVSYLLKSNYSKYVDQNKQNIKKEIRSYKFRKNKLRDIVIESKVKKEALENKMKMLISISVVFYILLLQSLLTMYIFYINNINNYAVTSVSSIFNGFLQLQKNVDPRKYVEFFNVVRNSFNEFNNGLDKIVTMLIRYFLGLLLTSFLFLHIAAERINYLIEMYNYQIEYSKKYLRSR